ncbi:MAG: alpha/beta hydrolase family protein [Bryobacteraceae bacterium]
MSGLLLLAVVLSAQSPDPLAAALAEPILDPRQPLVEAQVYTGSRVPLLPSFTTAKQWEAYSTALRRRILDEIVFRGEAAAWRKAKVRVEWLEDTPGRGYRLRKLRYEVIPGLWLPAVLYEPEKPAGRVPVVLNVNGHETGGIATPYIQTRCIHLARNGVIALNPEWFGRGQMRGDGTAHYLLNQFDLAGTSGLALFYLAMERALDLLAAHKNADPDRVAVTGLSGGGWQTIWISALDTRVRVANPVAGYSSFVTRAQWPDLDLGDSEQTPSDFASIADYTHLTALMAPRAIQLAYNAKDTCCFRADYAVAPLVQAARPIFDLVDASPRLRYHVNHGAGHNYDEDNRQAFYRLLGANFFNDAGAFPQREDVAETEILSADQIRVVMPADNLDFPALARTVSAGLPRKTPRQPLAALIRYRPLAADARPLDSRTIGGVKVDRWRIVIDNAWTVPVVEATPANPRASVILLADDGRKSMAARAQQLVDAGSRVVAVDPFYVGESRMGKREHLFAILVAALGERPAAVQAGQVAAVARWLRVDRRLGPVSVESRGARTGLMALLAAALEPAIAEATLRGSLRSLHEVIERKWGADRYPEMFAFGLLESYDIPQIAALAAPRKVSFAE